MSYGGSASHGCGTPSAYTQPKENSSSSSSKSVEITPSLCTIFKILRERLLINDDEHTPHWNPDYNQNSSDQRPICHNCGEHIDSYDRCSCNS